MRNRIICFFLAFLLILPISASAGSHLQFSASFSSPETDDFNAELYFHDNCCDFYSSLFDHSGYRITLPDWSEQYFPFSIQSTQDSIPSVSLMIKSFFSFLFTGTSYETRTGSFSGDLFETAHSLNEIEMTYHDFAAAIEGFCSSAGLSDHHVSAILFRTLLLSFGNEPSAQNQKYLIRSFDDEKYGVIEIIRDHDETIMTVSADLSSPDGFRMLFSHSENRINVFRFFSLVSDDERTEIGLFHYLGASPSFRSVQPDKPLLSEKLNIGKSADNKQIFDYTMTPQIPEIPFHISGSFSYDGDEKISAEGVAFFNDQNDAFSTVCVIIDDQLPEQSLTDLKEADLSGTAGASDFCLQLYSRLLTFTASFLPSLPIEYQKLLNRLIYSPK